MKASKRRNFREELEALQKKMETPSRENEKEKGKEGEIQHSVNIAIPSFLLEEELNSFISDA